MTTNQRSHALLSAHRCTTNPRSDPLPVEVSHGPTDEYLPLYVVLCSLDVLYSLAGDGEHRWIVHNVRVVIFSPLSFVVPSTIVLSLINNEALSFSR